MSAIVSVFYPLWYEAYRSRIKNIVDTANYNTAKTELENVITEHDTWLGQLGNPLNRIYGENIMMKHALRHLNATIDKNDPEFLDNGILKHQSDLVKEGLVREPKSNYLD